MWEDYYSLHQPKLLTSPDLVQPSELPRVDAWREVAVGTYKMKRILQRNIHLEHLTQGMGS